MARGKDQGVMNVRPLRRIVVIGAIVLIACAFRLWRIETLPPGLYVDEVHFARNAFAWRIGDSADLLGSRPFIYEGSNRVSNANLAVISTIMAAAGDGLVGVRLVSVLPSLLCVLLAALLARELADDTTAAMAAFFLAASHWAARSGRTGWEMVEMTALQLAALALLARATRRASLREAVPAGLLGGASCFTYLASRIAVAHVVLWQMLEAWRGRDRRGALKRVAVVIVAVVVIAGPYFYVMHVEHPGSSNVRLRRLSPLSATGPGEPWRTLAWNTTAHLLMFNFLGAKYSRDALPGFPMLDPVTGLLFLVGVAVVWRQKGWQRRLLFSWFATAIAAGILSTSREGPPYAFRVGNLAPFAAIVAAIGAVWIWRRMQGRVRIVAAIAVATAVIAINAWVLFVAWPRYPGVENVYGVAPTTVGRWLAQHRGARTAVVDVAALYPAPLRGFRYDDANRTNFYRPVDAAAATQLAAGVYAMTPARSLEPLAFAGDVDVVGGIPSKLPAHAIFVAPPSLAGRFRSMFRVAKATELRLPDGRTFAVVLEL